MNNYQPKAITTTLKFSSRASICFDKNYYTVECCEERAIPDLPDVDIEKERADLWDTVNSEVDGQIETLYKLFKEK